MKIRLDFKTPDVVDYALDGLTEDEQAEVKSACKKFVEYGECVIIEIDTEKGTAEVIPV